VFTAGVGTDKPIISNGRHRASPTERHGTDNRQHSKKHMTSSARNAPIKAFFREGDSFEGACLGSVHFHFYRTNECFSAARLLSFI